ncbi:LOW QUALITY PROTEIN: CCR4-NOT transcription complex subunit 1 [Nilaparvata lugens]|uniref:LOW QUALITY PROTEIN: CCR4-NOT transcription complex subunit 1 n=1 Tax=Nilaparvata lugens TaxID=108931 RepID=UPI00193DFFE7|nr:LOW QUALITY PROTEIN: CCR4-NOT transcription complex subunit 1 [Nilaparvata lugens]
MNLDSLSFTLSQISYLVTNLSKKNYKSSVQEISQLTSLYGCEADRHLLRCLLSAVEWSGSAHAQWSSGPTPQVQLLAQECAALLAKPALVSNLCFAIDRPLYHQKTLKPSNQLLPTLSKVLKLTPVQEVVFGLALLHSSNPETLIFATQFVRQKLPDLIRVYINSETGSTTLPDGGLHDTTPEVLHLILSSVLFASSEHFGVTTEVKEVFLKNLRRDFPRELVPVVLAPLLYPSSTDLPMDKLSQDSSSMANTMHEPQVSLADLLLETGYSLCASVETCRQHLLSLGGGADATQLTPATVARCLAMMVRTHTGLDQAGYWHGAKDATGVQVGGDKAAVDGPPATWAIDVFVTTVKDLVPNLQWTEVMIELDHADFIVKDRQGLNLIVSALRLGIQTSPNVSFHWDKIFTDQVYKPWKHPDSQLSLIQQCLRNPDIFCFADNIQQTFVIDALKAPPENDNKEIASWRCLSLVETLLCLSERGLYVQVQDIMKFPIQHCPDVLVLGLIHVSGPMNVLRTELLTSLIPLFLGSHPNSNTILHAAWSAKNVAVKPVVMHAMAEWYLLGDYDQVRLSRILEIAQDLKVLYALKFLQSLPFIIDLACLASRREYLKLDKWLGDKIREHGEPFVAACVKFLQRRCPQIVGGIVKDENLPKAAQLPQETITTMLLCLQSCAGSIQQELADAIHTMVANCSLQLSKQRQPPPGVLRAHRAALDPTFSQFAQPQVDSLSLSSTLAGMSLGGGGGGGGGSPSRLLSGPLPPSPGPPFLTPPLAPLPPSIMAAVQRLPPPHPTPHPTPQPPQHIDKSKLGGEIANLFPDPPTTVSKEVEDEANSYFQRIYNHPPHPTLSIDEVLDMLKAFQESQNKRERDVYHCMLRNLFEEYRFFPQYPEKELHTTAQLFGGIIDHGLVTNYVMLGLALRLVLDALRKPHGTKMYYFGIAALDRFKSKLKEYQKYCEHVVAIPHFKEFPGHLIEYLEYGLQGQEPPNRPQGPVLPAAIMQALNASTYKATPTTITTTITSCSVVTKTTTTTSVMGGRPSIANATNIDTLLVATEKDEKMIVPPEAMQDKVAFIFNNLSQLNLPEKCDELRDLVTEEFFPWISQYLVMKRASIELNFHTLYSNFLDVLKINDVKKMVLVETYRNIRVLLRSDKGIANFSDRSLLKNLGHWLGMLTLGRNRPILQGDLDLKSLLAEAYSKGQQELLYVVPFVAKVLESCCKSRIFGPPNPWTMSIMNVLSELHSEPGLKLNLKFEIEVLCKNLSLDVAELTPGIFLKDPENLKNLEHQLSSPKNGGSGGGGKVDASPVPQPQAYIAAPPAAASTPVPVPAAPAPQPQPQLQQHVVVTPMPVVGGGVEEVVLASSPVVGGVGVGGAATPTPTPATPQPAAPAPLPPLPPPPPPPPEPRFSYAQLNVNSIAQLAAHVTINTQLALFQAHPALKQLVRQAVERSVSEWIHPVVDRSVKIALTTAEHIVKKDFALDPEETRMRLAAHHMVRHLTAGMAMITCRDQLMIAISNNLKQLLANALLGAPAQKELIEQAATISAQDNIELGCAFIQKTAVEKALSEVDKHLMPEFERRKMARQEGRRYCDSATLTYQAERMPEQIRLKVGGASPQQMAVYEAFARNIPGFQPLTERELQLFMPQTYNATDDMSVLYDKLISDFECYMQTMLASSSTSMQIGPIHSLTECLVMTRRTRDTMTAVTLIQKAVEGLLDGSAAGNDPEAIVRYRELHLRVLKTLQDPRAYGIQWINKQVTRCLMESREEYRYNVEAVDMLIRQQLVNVAQYDQHIALSMESGINYVAVAFAMQLVQHYLVDDRTNQYVTEQDLCNTIDVLQRIALYHRQPPEGLATLIEVLRSGHDPNYIGDRAPGGPTAQIHSGILQVRARDYEDPPGLTEKTEFLLREWVTIYHSNTKDPQKAFSCFVHQMNLHGILKTDDLITRFFRLSTQMVVELCYRLLPDQSSSQANTRNKIFHTLDAFVKLIALLVKHSGDSTNTATKINLLNKVLGIVAGVLLQDHEGHQLEFQQLPYHRLFIMLFLELNSPEPILEAISFQVLAAFCHTLHILRPGTLRVLLVLLHDFPEFLCDYHYGFCDVIPPNCIQMRNLILSAFPRNMRLPDPFTPNLKVDMLSEISLAPRVLTSYASIIQPATFKKDLDSYLKARAPVTFLSELRSNLQVSNEPGMRYNIPLMNALVLHVGSEAIGFIRKKGLAPNMSTIAHSAHMDIFQNLAVDLDTEGRYLFLNAIANQLRYPNSHTHYFSCTLLYLFAEANTEAIQEQITRVLLERLIVNRPHPWGLLITFIELIKNPNYKFWNHEFVHCAPEIEKLFESVARSCMVPKQVQAHAENELPEL